MNNTQRIASGILSISMGLISLNSHASERVVIQNKGSDTLVNVAQAWAEEYPNVDATVAVAISGGGSCTGF